MTEQCANCNKAITIWLPENKNAAGKKKKKKQQQEKGITRKHPQNEMPGLFFLHFPPLSKLSMLFGVALFVMADAGVQPGYLPLGDG